jgi:hypothetical protein
MNFKEALWILIILQLDLGENSSSSFFSDAHAFFLRMLKVPRLDRCAHKTVTRFNLVDLICNMRSHGVDVVVDR